MILRHIIAAIPLLWALWWVAGQSERNVMKAEHTKLPWKYIGDNDDSGGDFVVYGDGGVSFIGNVGEAFGPVKSPQVIFDLDKANAAFIVKAVNCHDELVAACEAAEAYTQAGNIPGTQTRYPQSRGSKARSEWIKLRRQLKAIIQKIKPGQQQHRPDPK